MREKGMQETALTTQLPLIVRNLGICAYQETWERMMAFTDARTEDTVDEIWLLQHPPVFTQGLAGKAEHILDPGDIPVVQTDRGGQVTYHGPGQLVAYMLFDLRHLQKGIRQMVCAIEKSVVALLAHYAILAKGCTEAPGVYVEDAKICSIGLRVRKGCTYHGIALNVAMDLSPFLRINPCGFKALSMTQIAHWLPDIRVEEVMPQLVTVIAQHFGFKTGTLPSSFSS